MELIIIRHGESHFNSKETNNLNSSLTLKGRTQCYTCGAFLRRKFGDMADWKGRVSPFLRTIHTADLINRYTNCKEFKVDWQIREFAHLSSGYGNNMSLEIPSYRQRFPNFYSLEDPNFYIQKTEFEEDLINRIIELLEELKDDGGKFIIVSHGLTIYTMIYILNGTYQVPSWDKKILNTSVTYFKNDQMIYFARYVNGGNDPRDDSFEYMMM